MNGSLSPDKEEGGSVRDNRAKLPRFILATTHLTLRVEHSRQYFAITRFDRRAFGTRVVVLALAAMWPYMASWIACRDRIHSTTIFRSTAFVLVLLAGAATLLSSFWVIQGYGLGKVIALTALQATIYVALAPIALGAGVLSRGYPDFCVLSHTLPKEREYGDQERDFGRVAEG